MSVDHRGEPYDRVRAQRDRAPVGERPVSPAAALDEYITDEQLEQLSAFTSKQWTPTDLDEYKSDLETLADRVEEARAQLADIEADWSGENRPWFYWGLTEIKAERATLSVNKRLVERALSKCSGMIRSRNRTVNEQQQAQAMARRADGKTAAQLQRAAQTAVFNADPEYNRARRELIGAAFKVAAASLDSPEVWELRAAVDEYIAQRDRLRAAEHESTS